MRDPLKYQFVTNIPSPYQLDFFRALEAAEPGAFEVIFVAPTERDRSFPMPESFGFQAKVLPSSGFRLVKDWHRNPRLESLVKDSSAQLVVLGGSYFMPDARAVRRACKLPGKKVVYWGEQPFKKVSRQPWDVLKRVYLSWFFAPFDGGIGVGRSAAIAYGALLPGRPFTDIPYAPDLAPLLSPSDQLLLKAAALRRNLGAVDQIVVLFAGALTTRKAPDLLLESFWQATSHADDCHLVFAGDGPLRADLLARSVQLKVRERVHLLGYLGGEELQSAYVMADVFVLPTRGHEGWGVVLQEAMAAGCAAIASDRAGAAQDLIHDGETGVIVAAGSKAQLASALVQLCQDRVRCRTLGEAGRHAVRRTSAHDAARRFARFANQFMTLPA